MGLLSKDRGSNGCRAIGDRPSHSPRCVLLDRWLADGGRGRINMVSVHRRVEDWEYDR